ncbi:MAG TPA: ClpX C4-type zinc finger protein [Pseudolabrys sp.]|nr:ClpX C4-type zinc finger protein [Pseudolabrys sp.]
MPKQQTQYVECSFCGTKISTSDKGKVVAGPKVFICRDCVGLCIEVMADEAPEWREQKIEALKQLRSKPMPELYVVNEVRPGQDARRPGDVQVFSSAVAVEGYFEPWYIDETYLLLDQDAKRHIFKVVDDRIVIADVDDQTDYSDTLREFLVSSLGSVERATWTKKKIGNASPTDFNSFTTDELVRLSLLVSDY